MDRRAGPDSRARNEDMIGGLSWKDSLPADGPSVRGRLWAFLIPRSPEEAEKEVQDLIADPPEGGVAARLIRGERCRSERLLFEEWATTLGFPTYFGNNWDAFDEVVGEYLILEDGGLGSSLDIGVVGQDARLLVVLVTRSEELLIEAPERWLKTLVEILERAPLEPIWEGGKPDPLQKAEMRVVFQCDPAEMATVRRRFERVGLSFPNP